MGEKFQDNIKPKSRQRQPVKLIAINVQDLPSQLIPAGHTRNDDMLLVFTGAVTGPRSNIFHSHQGLLVDAGYNSGYNLEDKAIKFTIPKVHEEKRNPSHKTFFAPAQSVTAAEIKVKFPNAEITYVKSVDDLAKEYKSLVAERQDKLAGLLEKERLKLKAAQDASRGR